MLKAGEDPRFIARRMVIFASEDVGNADPRLCSSPSPRPMPSSMWACPRRGSTSPRRRSTSPRAPKSNAVSRHRRGVARRARARSPPPAERCATRTTPARQQLGHGEGYVYPHDDPRGFDVDHLPERACRARTYYHPSGQRRGGEESARSPPQRMRSPSALATSSTASRAVRSVVEDRVHLDDLERVERRPPRRRAPSRGAPPGRRARLAPACPTPGRDPGVDDVQIERHVDERRAAQRRRARPERPPRGRACRSRSS